MSQAALARHLGRSGKTIEQQVSALRRKFAIPRGERVDWARLAEESD
jgi:DNA-binding CsgD family transcriptional regulator